MPSEILLAIKSPPYGSLLAAECLRVATAMVAMDMLPRLLFIDDGVYCLLKGQNPEQAGLRSFRERLKTLVDLIGSCVAEHSLYKRNLKKTDLDESYNLKIASAEEVAGLFLENEAVIAF